MFIVGANAHIEGVAWAQDDVELRGNYTINGYDVLINTGNPYLVPNGVYVGTFSKDIKTLTIHNFSDGVYSSPSCKLVRISR